MFCIFNNESSLTRPLALRLTREAAFFCNYHCFLAAILINWQKIETFLPLRN